MLTAARDSSSSTNPQGQAQAGNLPTTKIWEYLMANPSVHDLVPIWLAIGVVSSVLTGTVAGVLGWLGGEHVAAAVLTGGAAFGGALTLWVLVIRLLCR